MSECRNRAVTIYALSSGSPPAAIAVVRISGPGAGPALKALARRIPEPRRACAVSLRHPATGELLDHGLVLFFQGPATATGEDVAELHLHGGRSVVASILAALGSISGLRAAEPGEFTRRAFENGRIDLAEAEGLADLLAAETETQRRAALALAGGSLSRIVEEWQHRLLAISARLEAAIDYADEGDVAERLSPQAAFELSDLAKKVQTLLSKPALERLRDGVRVVIAGPPNSGKSSLLNALCGRDAAITSPIPGTTRDLVEAPTALEGRPFLLVDTAGLREAEDPVESIGIGRARDALLTADIILWLGRGETVDPDRTIVVQSKSDIFPADGAGDFRVSAKTGEGLPQLIDRLSKKAMGLLPQEGDVAINARHRAALTECSGHLVEAQGTRDELIAAECLRLARGSLDRVTGKAGVENMLDSLFSIFCIGK